MYGKRYFMAPDCPVCGQKDEEWKWLGARMGSTAWGHNYSCCSDACGIAFKDSSARYQMELQSVEHQIAGLKSKAAELRSKILIAKRQEKAK